LVSLMFSWAAWGQPGEPADPALAAAYRRVRFSRQYPPEAVAYLQEQLQHEPRAAQKLDELANDKRPEVRGLVALLLGELGQQEGAATLWRLTRDDKESVRLMAAGGLVRLAQLVPVTSSTDGLKDERPEIRRFTATVLGNLHDKTAELALIQALQDTNEFVRADVVRALSVTRAGTVQALPSLLEMLYDPSVEVRTYAVQVTSGHALPAVVPPLLEKLQDADWHVRAAAALALGGWVQKEPRVVEALIHSLLYDTHALVRDRAADALWQSDNEQVVAALVQAIVSGDHSARFHAVRALILAKATRCLPLLQPHACDPDPEIRAAVMEVFGAIGGPAEIPAVVGNLHDEDMGVRLAAVRALRQMKGAESVPDLLRALEDHNPHVRAEAALALGAATDRSAVVPNLIRTLRDPFGFVRAAAAESLGRLGDRQAVPYLVGLLTDQNLGLTNAAGGLVIGTESGKLFENVESNVLEMKVKVVEALGEIRDVEAGDAVISHGLSSSDPSLRAASAVTLGKMRYRPAVAPLTNTVSPYYAVAPTLSPSENVIAVPGTVPDTVRIMRENEAKVRSAVAWALGQIGDPAARSLLEKALNDQNSLVRDAAAEALARIAENEERQAAAAASKRSIKK